MKIFILIIALLLVGCTSSPMDGDWMRGSGSDTQFLMIQTKAQFDGGDYEGWSYFSYMGNRVEGEWIGNANGFSIAWDEGGEYFVSNFRFANGKLIDQYGNTWEKR